MNKNVPFLCSECKGEGRVRDPFGMPGETMTCMCVDYAEMKAADDKRVNVEPVCVVFDRMAEEWRLKSKRGTGQSQFTQGMFRGWADALETVCRLLRAEAEGVETDEMGNQVPHEEPQEEVA